MQEKPRSEPAVSHQKTPNVTLRHTNNRKRVAELTVKELHNRWEIHVVFKDDRPVVLQHREREEKAEIRSGAHLGGPRALPHSKNIFIV